MITLETSSTSYIICTDHNKSRVTVRRYPNEVWVNVVDDRSFTACSFILPLHDFRDWVQVAARMTDE